MSNRLSDFTANGLLDSSSGVLQRALELSKKQQSLSKPVTTVRFVEQADVIVPFCDQTTSTDIQHRPATLRCGELVPFSPEELVETKDTEFAFGRRVHIYRGQLRPTTELREGKGVFQYADGETFFGDYRSGRRNGFGVFLVPTGYGFEGSFKDDKPNGPGRELFPCGSSLTGNYQDGLPHGYCVLATPRNGTVFAGKFFEGERHGPGMILYDNGDVVAGNWNFGKRDGVFQHYYCDKQRLYAVNWKNDLSEVNSKYIGEGTSCRPDLPDFSNFPLIPAPDMRSVGIVSDLIPDAHPLLIMMLREGFESLDTEMTGTVELQLLRETWVTDAAAANARRGMAASIRAYRESDTNEFLSKLELSTKNGVNVDFADVLNVSFPHLPATEVRRWAASISSEMTPEMLLRLRGSLGGISTKANDTFQTVAFAPGGSGNNNPNNPNNQQNINPNSPNNNNNASNSPGSKNSMFGGGGQDKNSTSTTTLNHFKSYSNFSPNRQHNKQEQEQMSLLNNANNASSGSGELSSPNTTNADGGILFGKINLMQLYCANIQTLGGIIRLTRNLLIRCACVAMKSYSGSDALLIGGVLSPSNAPRHTLPPSSGGEGNTTTSAAAANNNNDAAASAAGGDANAAQQQQKAIPPMHLYIPQQLFLVNVSFSDIVAQVFPYSTSDDRLRVEMDTVPDPILVLYCAYFDAIDTDQTQYLSVEGMKAAQQKYRSVAAATPEDTRESSCLRAIVQQEKLICFPLAALQEKFDNEENNNNGNNNNNSYSGVTLSSQRKNGYEMRLQPSLNLSWIARWILLDVSLTVNSAKAMDKQRTGFISLAEILRFSFPSVPCAWTRDRLSGSAATNAAARSGEEAMISCRCSICRFCSARYTKPRPPSPYLDGTSIW